ncbi:MAG: hydantoinase/oxoprolinase family protein, partial [Actinobacteria bacterium]|nr:hydantoinase/oxoprolinase family protein [Actinomycetota bacterium]
NLYPEKARTAVSAHVSEKMGVAVDEAALSIIRIANANMAKGISAVSVEKGYDLREFVLMPFGGAAANHAVEIARELGIPQVLVPEVCGSFSAVGLVVSDIQHDFVRTIGRRQDDVRPDDLLSVFQEMEAEGVVQLADEGVEPAQMVLEWAADLRYEGQSWELTTPLKRMERLSEADVNGMVDGFHVLHQQVYSYSERSQPIEFINLRVKAVGRNPQISLPRYDIESPQPDAALKDTRQVCVGLAGWASVPIYERSLLPTGSRVSGPAVVEEQISTTFLPPGSAATIDEFRNIAIDVWSE